MKPHINAEVAHAFLDGKECEYYFCNEVSQGWFPITDLRDFYYQESVRIKPIPKPDIVDYLAVSNKSSQDLVKLNWVKFDTANLRLIWDGETLELKSAEVIK